MGVQRAGMGGGTHGMDCARQETGVPEISAALSQPRHAASAQLTIALAPQVGAQTHVRCYLLTPWSAGVQGRAELDFCNKAKKAV